MRFFSTKITGVPSGPRPSAGRVLVALAAMFAACTERPLGGGEGSGTSTGASTGAVQPSTGSGPVDPTTGGGVTGEPPSPGTSGGELSGTSAADTEQGTSDSCGFICEFDLPPDNFNCPGTQQLDPECPEGFKCTVEGSVGDTQCVEVAPDPKGLYEPCTVMGDALSGFDDCGVGMLCWDVNERGQGTCIGMCDGDSDSECVCADPKAEPSWCQECAVGLCFPGCDPVLQDCNDGNGCYPVNDGFLCAPDASEDAGQVNDPCEFVNVCDPGLACIDSATASAACDPKLSAGCCQPFCAFPGAACPNPDQECVPWFEAGQAPEGQENIGICVIPQ